MSFFRIKDLSPALDGLIVETEDSHMDPEITCVKRIVNVNAMVGDRTLSFPVSNLGMFIRKAAHLQKVDDPQIREFAHTNPWGKCLFEGRYDKNKLEIAYAKYEYATQVTVTEKYKVSSLPQKGPATASKTLFTGYFTAGPGETNDEVFEEVQEIIESHLSNSGDLDDLIFDLRELQEG